jgi:hypothetical protein
MNSANRVFVGQVTLNRDMTSINDQMRAIMSGDAVKLSAQRSGRERCSILFWDYDNWGIHVHVDIHRLMGLKSKFQASSRFLAKTFEGLTGNVLRQFVRR